MIHTLIQLLIIATGCAFLLGLRYGFIAATESDSPRKGNACLIATGMFGLIFCLAALAVILYNHSLPILENEGQVKSVQVIHGDNKHYSAFLQIHTLSSGDISIHASNRSDGFHRGEQVKFRYQGGTGELLKAWFFTADGRQEGVFNGTSTWAPYVPLLFGLFLIWGAFKQFHRDPEGAEVRIDENSGLLGTVDEESLLQLSKSKSEDCL